MSQLFTVLGEPIITKRENTSPRMQKGLDILRDIAGKHKIEILWATGPEGRYEHFDDSILLHKRDLRIPSYHSRDIGNCLLDIRLDG
jgi:hypothetical protein